MLNLHRKTKYMVISGLALLALAGFALLPRESQNLNAEDCRPYSQNGSALVYRCANGAMFTQTSPGYSAPSNGNYTLIPTNVNFPSTPYHYNNYSSPGNAYTAPNPWQQNYSPAYPSSNSTQPPVYSNNTPDIIAAGQGTAPYPDSGGPLSGVDASGQGKTVGVGPGCTVTATHKCLY